MLKYLLDFHIYLFSCVDDGFCSLEQADLIQRYVEKKLHKLYRIEQTLGKSLFNQDDDEDDDVDENQTEQIDTNESKNNDEKYIHTSSSEKTVTKDTDLLKKSPAMESSKSPRVDISFSNDANFSTTTQTKSMSPSSLSETSGKAD